MRMLVFGGTRTSQSMLDAKYKRVIYPHDTRLVPLSLRDLYTPSGHRRIHDLSMQYDHVHYNSTSAFCLGTQCHLEGKTIVLEGIPYAKNLQSFANGLLPIASPTFEHVLPTLIEPSLRFLSFDDAWYGRYLESLTKLGLRNRVYVVHSKADQISLYSDAMATIARMRCAGVCILGAATHHTYHKHVEYTWLMQTIVTLPFQPFAQSDVV